MEVGEVGWVEGGEVEVKGCGGSVCGGRGVEVGEEEIG